MRTRAAMAALLVCGTASTRAFAQVGDQAACESRLRAEAAAVDDDARHARTWRTAWFAIGTALFAGQAALALADVPKQFGEPIDFAAGAFKSVFIPALLLAHPPAVISDAETMDARVAATTLAGRDAAPCVTLARVDELREHAARDERRAHGWLAHGFVVAGNVAVGLLLALGYSHWQAATTGTVAGILVGETQIFTAPRGAMTFSF